jgi:peptide/nickel transport system permease protein
VLIYAFRRLALAIPTLLGVTIVAFILIHAGPGDPSRIALGVHAPESAVRAFNHEYGLDQPWLTQYWNFLTGAVTLDFGKSLSQDVSVASVISERAVVTVALITYSITLALVIAVPVSVAVSQRAGGAADHSVRAIGMVTFVMPQFWVGLILTLLFAVEIPIFPVAGYQSGVGGTLVSLALPALSLSLFLAPFFIRTLRSGLISTLRSPYIEAARVRRFSSRRILYRHALRPSSASLVTVVGITLGWLVSWGVVVESVFALQGLGTVLVKAVQARDFPLLQGLVVVIGVAVILLSLLTDLLLAALDPRVRVDAKA